MKQQHLAWFGIAMLSFGVGCAATNGDRPPAPRAENTRTPAIDEKTHPTVKARSLKIAGDSYAPFEEYTILVHKSLPPQFDVALTKPMPTPGWSFTIDKVDLDTQPGKILAHVTEVAPRGTVAQMIADTRCSIPLGSVGAGRYELEVWVRRGVDAEYRMAQTFTLEAF